MTASSIIDGLRLVSAFVGRQFALYKSYWRWEAVWTLYTLANALAIGFLARGIENVTGATVDQQALITYLMIGSLLWGYVSGLFWEVASTVSWERWEGTIEYTFMAPVPRVLHLVGICVWAMIYGVARTAILLAGISLFFHLDLGQANFWAAVGILAASTFAFVGVAMMVAVMPLFSPEKGSQMIGIVEAVLLMLSGVYYPISVLPGWMQVLAKLSPATYTLQGMRSALGVGEAVNVPMMIAVLLLQGAILVPLGALVFRIAETHAKRTGKLTRAG